MDLCCTFNFSTAVRCLLDHYLGSRINLCYAVKIKNFQYKAGFRLKTNNNFKICFYLAIPVLYFLYFRLFNTADCKQMFYIKVGQ